MADLKDILRAKLFNYLREREDFIASIPTMDPIWTAPFDLIGNVIEQLLAGIQISNQIKCPNMFLLLDNIVRSEDIRACAIQFNIKIFSSQGDLEYKYFFENKGSYKIELRSSNNQDFKVAIYLGTSGCQAFYSIIENTLRNTARHSDKSELEKVKNFSIAFLSNNIYKQSSGNYETVNNIEFGKSYFWKENASYKECKPLIITIEFHYDDKENEYKNDYIKVKIYDNLGGWTNENDNWVRKENNKILISLKKIDTAPDIPSLEDKLDPTKPEGKIIDETGQIIPGGWGLKEMRICASFLRGLKIQDYEQIPKDAPPVIKPFIYSTNDKNGSLGFEFYLPKVKDLLIISKEISDILNAQKETLKNQGIYIEESVDKSKELINRGTFTHEFVLIDVDDEENVQFIKDHILELPYKLFFLTKNDSLPEDVINAIKQIRYDLKKDNVDTDIQNKIKYLIIEKKELNNWFNNKDLEFDINNDKYLFNNSAEKIILEIRKRWCQYLYNDEKLPKVSLWPAGSKFWEDENFKNCIVGSGPEKPENLDGLKAEESANAILFAHSFGNIDEGDKIYKLFISNNPLCLFPFSRGVSADPIVGLFASLENPDIKGYNKLISYFNAVESGLTNFVIIDERIYDEANDEKIVSKVKINFSLALYLQNIVVFNLEDCKLLGYQIDKLTRKVQKKEYNWNGMILPDSFKNRVHFLVIHQSIIDKIGGKEVFQEFLNSIPTKYYPWYIVITSGRGHPESTKMTENTKFFDFSNLRKYIVELSNKIIITKIISQIKEEK